MSEAGVSSSKKTTQFSIVHEPISSSDEDMVQDCSSFLLERNESPKLISSEPKIPVLGRKRKIKENTVNENSTSIIEILESSHSYKKLKRSERKKRSKSKNRIIDTNEIIDLISDDEIVRKPPKNSMQIKRWKAMLMKLNSKPQMSECENNLLSRLRETPNDEKLKHDESILKNEAIGDKESILNIRKLKNNHFDKDLQIVMQNSLSKKRKDRRYFDEKYKDAKAAFQRANNNRRDYSFQERKQRERAQNDALDVFIKTDQEVKTISNQLYGISQCKYDLCQAGAEVDDTIYVTEQILGKFYPSREKSFSNQEDEIDNLFTKLRCRKYYEESEKTRIRRENEILSRHVTISERIDKIFKVKKSIRKLIFDVKEILKKL